MFANKGFLVAAAFVALALTLASPEEICDCEEKPKCPSEAPKDCGGGRGLLMVPGGEDCSCCEAVCPRTKGESCEGPHSLACDHGLICGDAGVCTDEASLMSGAMLTALSATDTTLTLGWKGPPGYVIQYREIEDGAANNKTEAPWKKFEKMTEAPEWNMTITDLKPEKSYEARAIMPGPEGVDQGRLGEPEAVVRAEVGCACRRPFFRIGSVEGDSGCTERPMAEKPCCVLVVCADSQTSETGTTNMAPRLLVNATVNTSTTAAPMTNSTEKMEMNKTEAAMDKCTHKNETLSIGQVFHDGCEQKCTCEAGGKVSCKPRCEENPHNISSKCFSIPDPQDICCTKVLCDVTLGDQDTNPNVQAESKGSPDAASTTMPPSTHNEGKEGCTYNGRMYAYDQEFHDGCKALCICSHDGQVECAPIHCPTDSGLDVLDPHCVTWEPVPMEPGEDEGDSPTCCPEVRCKDNGSCEYAGQRFDNFAEIPASVSEGCSGHRCFCEFGNITCGGGGGVSKCLALPPHAPATLQCLGGGPGSAILAHPPGDNCCLVWMCPEDAHMGNTNKGSTNSSAEGPVPEVTMIPQVDNVTVSTDDKDLPMTTMTPTNPPHESINVMEVMKSNMTTDTMDEQMNVTSENSTTSQDSTPFPTTITSTDNMQNGLTDIPSQGPTTLPAMTLTEMEEPMTTMLTSNPDTVEHRENENAHITTMLPTPSHAPDYTTELPHAPFIMTHETTTELSSGTTSMKPIVVDEKPAYQSPWGNIGGMPEGRIQNKNPKIPGPIQIPEEESSAEEDPYSFWYGATPDSPKKNESKPHMLVTTPNKHPQIPGPIRISDHETSEEEDPYSFWYGVHPDPPKKNGSKLEIPLTSEYSGPFANKAEEPIVPFKPIHDGRQVTVPNNQQKPNENIHKKPKNPDDGLPIFLRYPVQSGKKQRVDPQKSRLPERPPSPNVNDFEYQGPFLGVPPSSPEDHIVFHPQGGNIKQGGNFPTRPNGLSKNPGNIYGQQPPPFRQPSKYPGEHDDFPVPVLIHPGQRPPNQPPRVQGPGNQPIHGGIPVSGNAVQHHQGGAHPQEHFQIQDLEGGPVPPEIAQHILWALQGGRQPVGGEQRPQGPPQQGHRVLPPRPPPHRGPPQRIPVPQEVFFQVPSGVGPGNHPTAQNPTVFIPNHELPNYRSPPRIPQTQNGPPHLAQSPPHGPPHFLPGVEPEFLPPELYHLAFGGEHPDDNNRTKQETSPSSKTNKAKQPPMTHDHEHLTEDLPLNHPGTDFGHPPPPPSRFPEMPLHPHLHPQLHNVGVSSPSDEISVDAANVQPDSSVHLVFSLPSLFVGLHGQVEISYTQDPLKEDPETWEGKEIVSTPGDLIETRRLEYTIPAFNGKTGLQPNKVYRIRIMLLLRDLRNSPSSRIITIHTPSGNQVNTTQLPAQIEVDAELGIAEVNSTWARFVWRKFNDFELQFIDGVQLRYKEIEGKVYSTTQLLHRATVSYTLEGLRPSSTYEVSLLLVPFPDQKTELTARETLHITTAAEKDPYGFDLKIKVDNVKVFSAEVSWSGVPYPEDKYVNIFRVIYQSDSAGTKGGEGSEGGPDGEERSSTFKVAKRDPSPSALVTGLKPGTRYRMWLEAYLTNGRIKKSDVKDIVTKPSSSSSTKQGKLEASVGEVGKKTTEESGDYYGGLVGVSILAALAFVAILILLLMLLKRQGQAKKAAISTARKSESAYDNPTYKTSDHDSTNGRIKNSARLQEA